MIKVQNLKKIYGDRCVLDVPEYNFKSGVIYGLLGRNGAGKTTLVNIITNRVFASSGTCTVNDLPVYENDYAQSNIFCITEQSTYPAYLKVKDTFKWAKMFYPSFDTDYALELSQKFDLDINKRFKQLSTGYRTIAKVVLTLASETPVMILDEPVLGIDALYRKVFYTELLKTHKKLNNLVLLATHIMDEAESVVEHVIVLRNGIMVKDDTLKNVVGNHNSLQDAYVALHESELGGASN